MIALGAIYGLLIQPLVKVYKFFKVPGRLGKVKRLRMYATLAVIIGGDRRRSASFRCRRTCTARWRCRPAAPTSVYVEVDGIWTKSSSSRATRSTEGQLLAQLRNIDVDISIAELDRPARSLRGPARGSATASASKIAAPARKSIRSPKRWRASSEQLAQAEDDREKLRLVAPRAGTVLPPPLVEKQARRQRATCRPGPARRSIRRTWAPRSSTGTKLCQIGDPQSLRSPAGDRPGRRRVRRAGPARGDHAGPVGRVRVREHRSKRLGSET